MDRRAWWATVRGAAKSRTPLSDSLCFTAIIIKVYKQSKEGPCVVVIIQHIKYYASSHDLEFSMKIKYLP